jgi:murein DD-endopeptidase MepM/ murein hydrolase activator NlpD
LLHRSKLRLSGLRAKIIGWVPEREIIFGSGGQLRSIHISRATQFAGATALLALLLGAMALALSIATSRADIAKERAAIGARSKAVAATASKAESDRESVEKRTRELEARQDFMDDLFRAHFGEGNEAHVDAAKQAAGREDAAKARIGATADAQRLQAIDVRQRRFAALLTHAVKRRADKTAHAIRGLGLNPETLVRSAARAQGGPFVPWPEAQASMPQEMEHLTDALARMELLEAIPSARPTMAPMQSSSYGYRRDPFNGQGAFHAGIDFPGKHGEPIVAAAAGKVTFVGQRSGYGNVVEIAHSNGIMTRYAHLSGFNTHVGRKVAQGQKIARMGSTGRSTGDRPFLQASSNVREVQQLAAARANGTRDRG